MDGFEELERYGRPYWKCSTCEFASAIRGQVEMHVRDHIPHPVLADLMAAQAAPTEAPAAASRPRKSKE